ncbi:hypothetical protein J7E73_32325 [Paenibacillus albidus]|uniref:MFS transporter n=1 Tax=Paenibacillus albidus TaxID=2041023 RepID=UPI001BEB9B26|nr:MFS transporter [Paenibacillus albidus]MBT2293699.1 hypothetical protein [Paenibacillus albidus]
MQWWPEYLQVLFYRKFSYRSLLAESHTIMIVGLLFSTIIEHSSFWIISCYSGILGIGIGMGILMTALNKLTQELVPKSQIGIATSSVNLFRSLGATIGVSVLGAVLNNRVSRAMKDNYLKHCIVKY